MAECHDIDVEDPRYRTTYPKPTLSERAAILLWTAILFGAFVCFFIATTKAHGQHVPCEQQANPARFSWAANKPCGCAEAFKAAAQGCSCGQGCPCCQKEGGCKCGAPGQCAEDANYNSLRAQAIREGKTLIVSVGCPIRLVDGRLSCRLEQFPGIKAPVIAVCRQLGSTFSRCVTLKMPCTDADVRMAVLAAERSGQPQVLVPFCPNGNCPKGVQ